MDDHGARLSAGAPQAHRTGPRGHQQCVSEDECGAQVVPPAPPTHTLSPARVRALSNLGGCVCPVFWRNFPHFRFETMQQPLLVVHARVCVCVMRSSHRYLRALSSCIHARVCVCVGGWVGARVCVRVCSPCWRTPMYITPPLLRAFYVHLVLEIPTRRQSSSIYVSCVCMLCCVRLCI